MAKGQRLEVLGSDPTSCARGIRLAEPSLLGALPPRSRNTLAPERSRPMSAFASAPGTSADMAGARLDSEPERAGGGPLLWRIDGTTCSSRSGDK